MANPVPENRLSLQLLLVLILLCYRKIRLSNQVNNLGFPYIFRGALDVRATKINEAMKMAAVRHLQL
jgi:malate dehydrogenase (oxaloacetate-decarboxylating)(NADP+)